MLRWVRDGGTDRVLAQCRSALRCIPGVALVAEGLTLNLLGLIVEIDRIRITADRAGLLGGLLASLTCGGVESADRLEALAQMIRSQQANGGTTPPVQTPQ